MPKLSGWCFSRKNANYDSPSDRWSKTSISQSEAARKAARDSLYSKAYGDGAFLLRDSTSELDVMVCQYFVTDFSMPTEIPQHFP